MSRETKTASRLTKTLRTNIRASVRSILAAWRRSIRCIRALCRFVFFHKPGFLQRITVAFMKKRDKGHHRYTVITPVYNVEDYLDDYFRSLTLQTLDFRNNIRLILVDDGSLDGSGALIRRWQARYPENIVYLHKENGGPSSARNVGLDYMEGHADGSAYVTFIDPDDFVSLNYFKAVDQLAEKQKRKLKIIVCNIFSYYENLSFIKNCKIVSYKVKDCFRIQKIGEPHYHVIFSPTHSFFCPEIIFKKNLRFNEKLRLLCEDLLFSLSYTISSINEDMSYLESSIYIYRRREKENSLSGSISKNKECYLSELEEIFSTVICFIKTSTDIMAAKACSHFILIICFSIIEHILNNEDKIPFLSDDEINIFMSTLLRASSFIDAKTIIYGAINKYPKVSPKYILGFLYFFKKEYFPLPLVFIEKDDPARDTILLRSFGPAQAEEEVRIDIDGVERKPEGAEIRHYCLWGRPFVQERLFRLSLNGQSAADARLRVRVNEVEASLCLAVKREKLVTPSLRLADIHTALHHKRRPNAPH